MSAQGNLFPEFPTADTVREAFDLGLLFVEVDEPRPMTRHTAGFAGDGQLREAKIRFVHVISKPAKGEIRGYVLVESEKTLRVRTPNYLGRWPELDVEVQRLTGATSTLYSEDQ